MGGSFQFVKRLSGRVPRCGFHWIVFEAPKDLVQIFDDFVTRCPWKQRGLDPPKGSKRGDWSMDWFSWEKMIKNWGFPVNKKSHDPCFCDFFTIQLGGIFSASYWDLIWVNQPKRWLDTNSDCTFSWWNVVKHLHFTIQKRISRYFNQQGSSVLHQPGTSGIAGIARQCHSLPCWIGVHIWWIWWPCSYRVKTCYSTIHGANCTVHELYLSNQLYQTISNPMLGNQQHYIEYCAVMFAGLQAYSTLDISTVIPCL